MKFFPPIYHLRVRATRVYITKGRNPVGGEDKSRPTTSLTLRRASQSQHSQYVQNSLVSFEHNSSLTVPNTKPPTPAAHQPLARPPPVSRVLLDKCPEHTPALSIHTSACLCGHDNVGAYEAVQWQRSGDFVVVVGCGKSGFAELCCTVGWGWGWCVCKPRGGGNVKCKKEERRKRKKKKRIYIKKVSRDIKCVKIYRSWNQTPPPTPNLSLTHQLSSSHYIKSKKKKSPPPKSPPIPIRIRT